MASIAFPTLPLPILPTGLPPPPVANVAAVTPVALLQAEFDALSLALPSAQAAPVLTGATEAAGGADGAAMRPDQVLMARQLNWPVVDAGALAGAWHGLVRSYGSALATREQQALAGQLPGALLQSGQDPRALSQADLLAASNDAWRFTVHAGGAREQHVRVVQDEAEQHPNRRRRARVALRLELVLEDGSVVTVQAEPVADGVRIDIVAPDARTRARLQALQPQLEAAVERTGLRVLEWTLIDALPAGRVHARVPSAEAASALGLPVFRAIAELALLMPA